MREMLGPPRRGPAYKTKLCSLWKRGSCSRASCSFAHGDGELRRPPSNSSFLPHPRPGGRDHRNHDLRGRAERRHSPRGRYSPGRDTRGHLFRDQRPRSKERGSSYSRSPIRKGEKRERKKLDGGNTDSSGSLDTSDKEDRKRMTDSPAVMRKMIMKHRMFGGYVNAFVSADGNYSSPLDDDLALF